MVLTGSQRSPNGFGWGWVVRLELLAASSFLLLCGC